MRTKQLSLKRRKHIKSELNKRLEKIEEELTSLGVDLETLKNGEKDAELLNEISSDNKNEGEDQDVDEESGNNEEFARRNSKAYSVHKMQTMEDKKKEMGRDPSKILDKISISDPADVIKVRLSECIDAIEYIKKNDLSKDQKSIKAILEKAEQIKKLQKRHEKDEDVEINEIPREVIPDDIFGFTLKQRLEKFQTIIKFIQKSMIELKMIGSYNFKILSDVKNPAAKENYERSIKLFKKQSNLRK